ncbi:MAG: hypothetical protein K2O45_07425 [Oscillospiraceae bacterium]|nr:hypothetical protein [Oscillospiraceae bacterium]
MRTIEISDVTLRLAEGVGVLSFKERVEAARTLDRLGVDQIELPVLKDGKGDVLRNKTIASVVSSARLSAAVGLTEESIEAAWESIKSARQPVLHIMLPASSVQMEYLCHKKAPAILELAKTLAARARYFTEHVEFSILDATRAEKDFLHQLTAAALEAGAEAVTVCDSAGIMTPDECAAFVRELLEAVPGLEKVRLGMELSNGMKMAAACAAAAVDAGAAVIKAAITPLDVPSTLDLAAYLSARGESKGLRWNLRGTELTRAAGQLQWMMQTQRSGGSPFDSGVDDTGSTICLTAGDGIEEMVKVVRHLGYDLTEEDHAKIYESFQRIAAKKHFVSARELDAIVASAAMQVPSTYRIVNYVITCGNMTSAMANLTLEKDGEKQQGVCAGDGPIDAAFLAIEQIIGHHYELADYQIQTVTEGREAMGSALVKLRSNGKLYSGNGISTDVIGASIRAYISALNKIVYEGN